MIRYLLTAMLLLTSVAHAQIPTLPLHQCVQHSPWGWPQSTKQLQLLCRTGYISAYDSSAKIPGWVAYTLTPQRALGCLPRGNDFAEDRIVLNGPKPEDYTGTGFDRGHAAPDSDLAWSRQAQLESYLMTNMYPQAGSLNRGIWKLLETTVRGWVVQSGHTYTIYVGAIYSQQDRTIGRGVVVPSWYYKIVVNQNTNTAAAWAFPHRPPYPNLGNDMTKFRVGVANISALSGVQFVLPPNVREIGVGQEWPVDYGRLTDSKRAQCKVDTK